MADNFENLTSFAIGDTHRQRHCLSNIWLKSLQRLLQDAEYFCIKFCLLLSAMSLTDWQLNSCIHSVIVSHDFTQNILLKQQLTAKSREIV